MNSFGWNNATVHRIGYLIFAFPVRVVIFSLTVSLVALSFGLIPLFLVGLPMLAAVLTVVRYAADLERQTMAGLTGRQAPPSPYRHPQPGENVVGSIKRVITDPQSWRDVAWAVVALFASVLTFAATLVLVAMTVTGLLSPLLDFVKGVIGGWHYGPAADIQIGITDLLYLPFPLNYLLNFMLGVIGFVITPRVIKGLFTFQVATADALLNGAARQEVRYEALAQSRTAAHKAEADALRQVERDIHDGPQQRLIRLNMDLARARRNIATSPEQADTMLAEAMQQTADTLAELRNLSRGIAPPILVDRGIAAAVQEVADGSPIPAHSQVQLPPLPAHVEHAAYFIVAEGLANANKHSQAAHIYVNLSYVNNELIVSIRDNGVGGASLDKGHGLSGLAQRLHGLGGTLHISSPAGGPTVVEAHIPCES
ncbi:MAG: sensor histidine kinase [Actinomycetaceae bacterium]|nr:sensor histidine kinase [Actinomycetaceae bacterium]